MLLWFYEGYGCDFGYCDVCAFFCCDCSPPFLKELAPPFMPFLQIIDLGKKIKSNYGH
jgi:hypothetical protein